MEKVGKLHILLLYREMIPSIRLCGHIQLEELNRQEKIEYKAIQERHVTNDDLSWAEIVILGRFDSWYEYQLAVRLRRDGRYLIYIIDDDLLNVPSMIDSAAYYNQPQIQNNIRRMIDLSDAILSPSVKLLKKYTKKTQLPICIEEPATNVKKFISHDDSRPVKIGFAGSIDRVSDVESILKSALLSIKDKYGDGVCFEFYGAIPSFAGQLDARLIPYCDSYDNYRQTLNELDWDIGLAPMPDTEFHSCKHYNKYIEYAASGIVGIFSDVEPYKQLKKLNPECILCDNETDSWINAISNLIEDDAQRERSRARTVSFAMSRLSTKVVSNDLIWSLNKIEMSRPVEPVRYHLMILKGLGVCFRGISFIEKIIRKNIQEK